MTIKKSLIALAIGLMSNQVFADTLSADFRTESDLPYSGISVGPLVYENLGAAIGAGEELTSANFSSNPSEWGGGLVHIDYDPITNIISLHSKDDWDFERFRDRS